MRPSAYMESAESFWGRTSPEPNTGCFIWLGSFDKNTGYGVVCTANTVRGAHRAAVFFATGEWPAPGSVVLHSCDNKWCVNPAHLLVGTQSRNTKDAWLRRRGFTFHPALDHQQAVQP